MTVIRRQMLARATVLALCALVAACADEQVAPQSTLMNAQGWPIPPGGWRANYRITVDVQADKARAVIQADDNTTATATISLVQQESVDWSESLSVDVVRGLLRAELTRTVDGTQRRGSLGDLVGIGERGRHVADAPGVVGGTRYVPEPRLGPPRWCRARLGRLPCAQAGEGAHGGALVDA